MRFVPAGLIAVTLWLTGQQAPPPFRAAVDAVTIDVSVYTANKPVSGLTAADFELTDNGVPQKLTTSSIETLPIDLTLVFDASGSVAKQIDRMREDSRAVAAMLQPDDRLRLVSFGTHVSQAMAFRAPGSLPAIDNLKATGSTSFHHALVAALLEAVPSDRRQLVVAFSDSVDTASFLSVKDVQAAALRTDAVLHLFRVRYATDWLTPSGWLPRGGEVDASQLTAAAASTGGRYHFEPGAASIPALVKAVLDEFRTSYVLRYVAAGVPAGGWHDVVVRITKPGRFTVRAKKGYFAGAGPGR